MQGQSDDTMFVKHINGKKTILIVYVDDIVLTRDDQEEMDRIKMALAKEFEVKDLGGWKWHDQQEAFTSYKGNVF